MANFDAEQAVSWVNIQQLINDWASELDSNEGLAIGSLVTEDCVYTVRGEPRNGRAAVEEFYRMRLNEFKTAGTNPPVQRHVISNLRVAFKQSDHATAAFTLVYFVRAGATPGTDHADPMAVADVAMETRRCSEGIWRIFKFDSNQTFLRKI